MRCTATVGRTALGLKQRNGGAGGYSVPGEGRQASEQKERQTGAETRLTPGPQ